MRINSIDSVHPLLKEIILKFNERLEKEGIKAYPFETFRPFLEQEKLYRIGREYKNGEWIVIDKKKIVTKARPGFSYHTYGLAVDYVFDGDDKKQGIQWSWDNKHPWKILGKIGKECGLEWGGDFKTFCEYPHFQLTYGIPVQQLYNIFLKDGMSKVWEIIYNKQAEQV